MGKIIYCLSWFGRGDRDLLMVDSVPKSPIFARVSDTTWEIYHVPNSNIKADNGVCVDRQAGKDYVYQYFTNNPIETVSNFSMPDVFGTGELVLIKDRSK